MSQGEGTVAVERSLRALDTLSPGPEQVAAAERAVALADEHGTPNQQIQARINLIAVYETSRPGEHELPHLSWLLNQLRDAGPALTERQRFEVLWECRFALARTRRSARIPLKIVRRVYADIEKRYRTEGVSPNLYAKHRALLARDTDTPEVARRWLAAWMESPRDKLSDCAACDQAEQARAMAADGDYEGALGHAAELLDGNRRCGEEPHRLYGRAADWSMRLGLVDQAEHYHRIGWTLVAGQGRFAAAAADHLIYLARAGRSGRAVRLALQVQPFVGDALDDFDRMYTAAILTRVFRFARGHQMLPPKSEIRHRLRFWLNSTASRASWPNSSTLAMPRPGFLSGLLRSASLRRTLSNLVMPCAMLMHSSAHCWGRRCPSVAVEWRGPAAFWSTPTRCISPAMPSMPNE